MSDRDEQRGVGPGLPTGVTRGPLGARFVAGLIDVGVPVILVAVALLTSSVVLTFVLLVAALGLTVAMWAMIGSRAASVGLRVAGLQVVGLRDGRPIGAGRSVLRGVILLLLIGTGVGVIVLLVPMLRSARRQGPHDLAADSVVILARGRQTDAEPSPTEAAQSDVRPEPRPDPPPEPQSLPDEAVAPNADQVEDDHEAEQDAVPDAVAEPAGPPPPDQGWRGVLDDGQEFRIGHLVLMGRNPSPREGEEDAELIKVSDPARTVSKTHVAIDVDARGPFAVDRESTNGTAVTDADGHYTLLASGQPHRLAVGDVVAFGEHRVEIVRTETDQPTDPG